MHLSKLTPSTLTRAEALLRARYIATIEAGEEDVTLTVSLSVRDQLIVSGTSLRLFEPSLSAEDDKRSLWSVTFAIAPDATPLLIRPIPVSVDAGLGDCETAQAFSLGGKLAAFALFVAGAVLKRLNDQPSASDKPTQIYLTPRGQQITSPTSAPPTPALPASAVRAALAARTPLSSQDKQRLLEEAMQRLGTSSGKALEDDTGLSHGFVQRTLTKLRGLQLKPASARQSA